MPLSLNESINRFRENEARVDLFVNDETGYTSSAGEPVESLPAFLARVEALDAIAVTQANKTASEAAAASALTSKNAASASASTAVTAKNDAVAAAAGLATGIVGKATKADLDAALAFNAGVIGMVTNDSNLSNNGYYIKVGASGSGSWTKSTFDPNYSLRGAALDFDWVTGNNSNMAAAGDWTAFVASGSLPTLNYTGGELQVTFTPALSQAVYLPLPVVAGREYYIQATLRLVSGSASTVQIGTTFSTSPDPLYDKTVLLSSSTPVTLSGLVLGVGDVPASGIWIGVAGPGNNGCVIAIDDVFFVERSRVSSADYDILLENQTKLNQSAIDKTYLIGNNSTFDGPNDWYSLFNSVGVATSGGKLLLTFNSGANRAAGIPTSLFSMPAGKKYLVRFDYRLSSGTVGAFYVGSAFSSSPDIRYQKRFAPTSTVQTASIEIEGTTSGQLQIGVLSIENAVGGVLEFDNFFCFEYSDPSQVIVQDVDKLEAQVYGLLSGNDSSLDGNSRWAPDVGGLVLDYATNPGELTLDFTTGTNQNIYIPGLLTLNQKHTVVLELTQKSGTPALVRVGEFSSGDVPSAVKFLPTETKTRYIGVIETGSASYLSLGIIAAENTGGVISVDNIQVYQGVIAEVVGLIGVAEGTTPPVSFDTEGFLASLSRYEKPLLKVCVNGDSLMANDVGGTLPGGVDEGAGRRPPRLDTWSVPRRIYDFLSFNKPTIRRLDDAAWAKTGTWSAIPASDVWEGSGSAYYSSSQANAYVEITVPNGQENFALMVHRQENFGTLTVTLNGGSIAAYGNSTINLNRAKTGGSSDLGNPYHTELYSGLPAGSNVIRVSKANDATRCDVWGGWYWSGTTLMLYNTAHGGHNIKQLRTEHMQAELVENDFDAILWELPVMNDVGDFSSDTSVAGLQVVMSTLLGKDIMFMTPNPFGDNGAGTNYYPLYTNPTMEETCLAYCQYMYKNSIAYVNCFELFKRKIENRGGTLMGGEGGLWYTWDGQHPSADGAREWFGLIRPHLSDKPFSIV